MAKNEKDVTYTNQFNFLFCNLYNFSEKFHSTCKTIFYSIHFDSNLKLNDSSI